MESEGQQYLLDHFIDHIAVPIAVDSLLPEKEEKWSVADLESWFSSSEALERFQQTGEYKTLSSRSLEKARVVPYVFLVCDCNGPSSHECAPNHTPLQRKGSTLAEKFLWWSTLFHEVVRFIKFADSNTKYVNIWNEPDLVSNSLYNYKYVQIYCGHT